MRERATPWPESRTRCSAISRIGLSACLRLRRSLALDLSNMIYDGPGKDEDFGLEQITGSDSDRYKFRTAPLRNLRVSPAFFHNGAFTKLEDAIRHHLDVEQSARNYNPVAAGVDHDLTHRLGPIEPVVGEAR